MRSRPPLRPRVAVLATAGAVALQLTACGSTPDQPRPATSSSAPVSATTSSSSSPATSSASSPSTVASSAPPADFSQADPCALTPVDYLGSEGLSVDPAEESSVRRSDGADAVATLDAQMLDALLGCDAGYDVAASFYDHETAARAATAVDEAAANASAPASGTTTAMAASLSEHGVFVDVPDNQAASAKWIVDDIQVDVLVQYSDQGWDHAKVLEVLSGAVQRTNAGLADYR